MAKRLTLKMLFDEIVKINDRLDEVQKTIESFDGDREILTDVVGRLSSLEEQLKITRRQEVSKSRDIKMEVQLAGDKIESAVKTEVEEIKDIIKRKTSIRDKKGRLERIMKKFRGVN